MSRGLGTATELMGPASRALFLPTHNASIHAAYYRGESQFAISFPQLPLSSHTTPAHAPMRARTCVMLALV